MFHDAPAMVCVRRLGFRFWLAGLLLETAFSVSMKTTVMALTPWVDRSRFHEEFVADALKLTDRADEVMDTKGKMIYRPRPYYFALEK